MMNKLISLFFSCQIFFSCQTWMQTFDQKPLTVQFLALGKNYKESWKDRRDRLELIDQEFGKLRPYIGLFQEVLEKHHSWTESDEKILSLGALLGYQWQTALISFDEETSGIKEYANLTTLSRSPPGEIKTKNFQDGFLVAYKTEFEHQPVTVISYRVPKNTHLQWFEDELLPFLQEAVQRHQSCLQRSLLVGQLNEQKQDLGYKTFLEKIQFKDSSEGLCEDKEKCYTDRLSFEKEGLFLRNDRIAFSKKAKVKISKRNFDQPKESNHIKQWPSQTFGWVAVVYLPTCSF